MVFKTFVFKVVLRVIFLTLNILLSIYCWLTPEWVAIGILLSIIILIQIYELIYYVNQTNRKLIRFLESVKYSDFITGFSSGKKLGSSFRELDNAFNEVLEAFRKARSEKEEHLQYLNIVVEHVNVGVVSFDEDGNAGLINAAAKKLMNVSDLKNIEELIDNNSRLYKALFDLPAGKSALFKTKSDVQLAIHATEVRLAGKLYKLVALQNIQPELQKKELEAWQNLTKILRHEIMNSITPISSLTSTLKDILDEDLNHTGEEYSMEKQTFEDLSEGIETIEQRSRGLIKFINAYRDYTTIPLPHIKSLSVHKLFENVLSLLKVELKNKGVACEIQITPEDLHIRADEEQMEQVLINIVKNSIEAFDAATKNPSILLKGEVNAESEIELRVIDNGKGIIREALEKIFIPFYTTKESGSGIGLALSRQIMQLHHGTLHVESEPGRFTEFILRF